MKTSSIKRLLSFAFTLCMLLSFNVAVGATFKGDADFVSREESLAEQFEALLLNCTSLEERQLTLEKAGYMGIIATDLANVPLSSDDLAILNGTVPAQRTALTNRPAVITGPATRVIVANVDMPNYCLWPTIYKQTYSNWCSAGTMYTTLMYIKGSSPTQQTMVNYWTSGIDPKKSYFPPDLQLMRNYVNSNTPSSVRNYVHRTAAQYGNSQTVLNTDLKKNVQDYQPMIINMKSTNTTDWPYTTGGHFCVVNGLLTWESNQYFIGDPYYFTQYVSGATANNGEHKKTWAKLSAVLSNKNLGYVT